MQVKKLNKGDVLWWHGEFATTIAFVDRGLLGIKTEEGLINLVGKDGVIGESALLAEGGVVPKRRAAVIALEESTVTEYPVTFVREGAGVGIPRKVLRTLIGQTVTSACFVLAAHPHVPLVTQSMSALIKSISDSKEMVRDVKNWEDFAPDFAYLKTASSSLFLLYILKHLERTKVQSDALIHAGHGWPMNSRLTLVLNRALDGTESKLTNAKWAGIGKCITLFLHGTQGLGDARLVDFVRFYLRFSGSVDQNS